VHTVPATTPLPYEHVDRATAGLRAKVHYQLLDLGAAPDWSTLEIRGPVTTLDRMVRPWFEYRGVRAEPRRVRPRPPRGARRRIPQRHAWQLSRDWNRNTAVVDSPEPSLVSRQSDMASMWWSVISTD
jgi:hypothetical protein